MEPTAAEILRARDIASEWDLLCMLEGLPHPTQQTQKLIIINKKIMHGFSNEI